MGWWSEGTSTIGDGPADTLSEVLAGFPKPIAFEAVVCAFGQALVSFEKKRVPRKSLVAAFEPRELIDVPLSGSVPSEWTTALARALDHARREYEETLSRKPTTDELLETFAFVLRAADVTWPRAGDLLSLSTSASSARKAIARANATAPTPPPPTEAPDLGAAVERLRRGEVDDALLSYVRRLNTRHAPLGQAESPSAALREEDRDLLARLTASLEPNAAVARYELPAPVTVAMERGEPYERARAILTHASLASSWSDDDVVDTTWWLYLLAGASTPSPRGLARFVLEWVELLGGNAAASLLALGSKPTTRVPSIARALAFTHACAVWATALLEEPAPPLAQPSLACQAPLLVLARFRRRLAEGWIDEPDLAEAARRVAPWREVDEKRIDEVMTRAALLSGLMAASESGATPEAAPVTAGGLVYHRRFGLTVALAQVDGKTEVFAPGQPKQPRVTVATSFLVGVRTPPELGRIRWPLG